ncbi:hypothetical protein BHK69_18595 [Bosea vaviloviae]|uniref:Uncharacterized protein n=1 Tax=Bosea vaviloviae TaxID=1526658 RepID=A0A1D7U4C0_9HYPH|nr:hypothetical protein BHK69_18595 [Bosea vaviloviae]
MPASIRTARCERLGRERSADAYPSIAISALSARMVSKRLLRECRTLLEEGVENVLLLVDAVRIAVFVGGT